MIHKRPSPIIVEVEVRHSTPPGFHLLPRVIIVRSRKMRVESKDLVLKEIVAAECGIGGSRNSALYFFGWL